jgi:hypothetical protein
VLHESGTFVRFTQEGADLFAQELTDEIGVRSVATLLPEGSVKGNAPKLGRPGLGVFCAMAHAKTEVRSV